MMIFGNLSNGTQIFAGTNDGQGTWTPSRKMELVSSQRADSKTNTWQYALYKVSFENPNTGAFEDPEWRIYGEGKTDLIGDDISYTYDPAPVGNPWVKIVGDDGFEFTGYIPYVATYATAEEGQQALESSVPKFGCRDPPATNYDHTATMDDGSCEYGEEKPNYLMWGILGVVGILGISFM